MQYAMIIGVGVIMDNMLYIIAGLVLILVIAGLVLRKKKAQDPSVQSVQPHIKSGKKAAALTPTAKTNDNTPAYAREDIDKKFDHITIAQRFLDQQRHDKAIETLNRGLGEKPNDSQLSLKLLSVYATIDQPEDFNKVYDAIRTQNDPKTIAQANELKALFFEEQAPVAVQETVAENNTNFESIDFDLPTSQANDNKAAADQRVVQDSSPTLMDEPINNAAVSSEFDKANSTTETVENDFDLTLSDFEDDFEAPVATSTTPATSLDTTEDNSLDTSTISDTTSEDSDIIDFDFNLDLIEESNTLTETSAPSSRPDDADEETTLDSEEFILDFDDLVSDIETDTGANTNIDNKETPTEELTIDASQDDEDDFVLSLDDFDAPNSTETVSESIEPTLEESSDFDSSDFDNFVLEDTGFEETNSEVINAEEVNLEEAGLKDNSIEEISLGEPRFDDNYVESDLTKTPDVTAASPLLFDDNTLLEDNFDFEADTSTAPTSIAPVEVESAVSSDNATESVEDFSSRFSADFDFVKSLDSNQVTLELATQYIQLGEYDSAKRLLNEVMTQGNQEQQNQAKSLLERTA